MNSVSKFLTKYFYSSEDDDFVPMGFLPLSMWARLGRAGRAESTLIGSFCTRLLLPGGEAADYDCHEERENSGRINPLRLLSSAVSFARE